MKQSTVLFYICIDYDSLRKTCHTCLMTGGKNKAQVKFSTTGEIRTPPVIFLVNFFLWYSFIFVYEKYGFQNISRSMKRLTGPLHWLLYEKYIICSDNLDTGGGGQKKETMSTLKTLLFFHFWLCYSTVP